MVSKQWMERIIERSTSEDYETAKKEWEIVEKGDRDSIEDGPPCLCGRKIKHVWWCINSATGRTICAGSHCSGKFTDEVVKRKVNTLYGKVLRDMIERGIFEKIYEPEYSESVKSDLVNHIRSIIKEGDLIRLYQLRNDVIDMINRYNTIDYLHPILEEIECQIKTIQEVRQREIKAIQEARERERMMCHREMMVRLAKQGEPNSGVRNFFTPRVEEKQVSSRVISESREENGYNKVKVTKIIEGADQPSTTIIYS